MPRLRVVKRALYYPCADDLQMVRDAGGTKGLTEEQRRAVRSRERKVEPGDWCDDLPEESVASRVARGDVEVVDEFGRGGFVESPATVMVGDIPDGLDADDSDAIEIEDDSDNGSDDDDEEDD